MSAALPPNAELAPAKVNLALHVTGRRADGYHLLDSLVVFPGIGDLVAAEPAATLSLGLDGPFARDLDAGGDNLVLRAALLIGAGRRGAALHLSKTLPVASGLGGGSSDAAATLRLLSRLWAAPLPAAQALLRLGADVPACLAARPARMTGVGETLSPVALPAFWLVLANPGVPLGTARVFAALAAPDKAPMTAPGRLPDCAALAGFLRQQRNDLERCAISLAPPVADALDALRAQPGCALARMSGSGATCFGLFAAQAPALAAAAALRAARPAWWVVAAPGAPARRTA